MLIWLCIFVSLWWLSAFSIKLRRGADHHWLENMVWIRLVYTLCVWLHAFGTCVLPQSLWHPPLHRIHPWLLSPRRGPRSPPSQTRCLTVAPQTAASCWPTSLEKKESHWVINEQLFSKINKSPERYKNLNCFNICCEEPSLTCRDLDDKKFWKQNL